MWMTFGAVHTPLDHAIVTNVIPSERQKIYLSENVWVGQHQTSSCVRKCLFLTMTVFKSHRVKSGLYHSSRLQDGIRKPTETTKHVSVNRPVCFQKQLITTILTFPKPERSLGPSSLDDNQTKLRTAGVREMTSTRPRMFLEEIFR